MIGEPLRGWMLGIEESKWVRCHDCGGIWCCVWCAEIGYRSYLVIARLLMLLWRECDGVVCREWPRFGRCRRRDVGGCVLLVRGRRRGSRFGIGLWGRTRGGLLVPLSVCRELFAAWIWWEWRLGSEVRDWLKQVKPIKSNVWGNGCGEASSSFVPLAFKQM